MGPDDNPWKDGTILIKRMIEKYARRLARKENVEGLTVFIDTNPAFSVQFSPILVFHYLSCIYLLPLIPFILTIPRRFTQSLPLLRQTGSSSRSIQVEFRMKNEF